MSVIVLTSDPAALLTKIKDAIESKSVRSWSCDDDGDFTHSSSGGQWEGRAWLRPVEGEGSLTFGLIGNKKEAMTREVYGIYHGRFIEMLTVHFGGDFTMAVATAMPLNFDRFK